MTKEQKNFIDKLYPIIEKYAGNNYSPICIMAQAILESGWGKSSLAKEHFNFFGMKAGSNYKGKTVTYSTKEEINGKTVNTKGTFRSYPDLESGIAGYFGFISTKRYSNLREAKEYKDYATKIKEDGWATSSSYTKNLINIVEKYLIETNNKKEVSNDNPITVIAKYVIKGYYGNGNNVRSNNIYNDVQFIVNCLMAKKPVETNNDLKKALYEVALDVIKGIYGNGATNRRNNIYSKVRTEVNNLVKR